MMRKHNSITSLLFGFFIVFFSCQPEKAVVTPESVGLSSDSLELAEIKMQEYIDSGKYAGISTLVVKNGEIIQRANYGYGDLENEKAIEDSTIFRIFSMTKPITAVALMTLYDEGKFLLDDKIADYIPEFGGTMVDQVKDGKHVTVPQEKEMTIRHLLTHTSGISYGWEDSYVDSLYRVTGVGGWDGTLSEKVKILTGLPLNFQPGSKWKYGLSIDVAGYLVEVISGQPLDQFFRARVFDPLKMDDTGFYVPKEKQGRFSDVFQIDNEGNLKGAEGRFKDAFKKPVTLFSGGGGLVSTIDDYRRFCTMLLNKGELDGVRILKENTVATMMSDQLPEETPYTEGQGHGLAGTVILETGEYSWAGAASTKFWIDPKNEMIIITYAQLMPSNYQYADDFRKIVRSGLMKL